MIHKLFILYSIYSGGRVGWGSDPAFSNTAEGTRGTTITPSKELRSLRVSRVMLQSSPKPYPMWGQS